MKKIYITQFINPIHIFPNRFSTNTNIQIFPYNNFYELHLMKRYNNKSKLNGNSMNEKRRYLRGSTTMKIHITKISNSTRIFEKSNVYLAF